MKSKFIARSLAVVTMSFGSLSFAQGYDRQRADDHQRYENSSEQHSRAQSHWQGDNVQRGYERHEQRYDRRDRNDWRYGGGQAVYVQPSYVQPGYYAAEQPVYVQPGYAQPGYYSDSTAGDAALAIIAGGLISQLLVNH